MIIDCTGAGTAPDKAGGGGRLPSPAGLRASWSWQEGQFMKEQWDFFFVEFYAMQGCGSGPFSVGSGSSKSEFKKPDPDPGSYWHLPGINSNI